MVKSAGTGPGERQLLGPQTTGRVYRNLSAPQYAIQHHYDLAVPMRDGVHLRADLYQPRAPGRFPALVAISPYARQAQYLSMPVGMIEAGQTDFWVPRGYVHLIANVRGTCGSEGIYAFGSVEEHRDLYDLIEWVAAQDWCDGNVGMIGVSYFAIEQLYAALAQPPHLRAIFPWSGTIDWYREVIWHGGIFSGRFFGLYFNTLGMVSKRGGAFFRAPFFRFANWILKQPLIHQRFSHPPRDPFKVFNSALFLDYPPHPWDDIFYQVAVEHQLYDRFWQERDISDRLQAIRIPIYLGADWENVGVHLNSPFLALERLAPDARWRVGITPRGGLQWPWESMHLEALAWYDHWLKGRDTGIMEGPPIRYFLEGAGEWRATESWPLPETRWVDLWLDAEGMLSVHRPQPGWRDYLCLPPTIRRARNTNRPLIPTMLAWDSVPFTQPVEIIGPLVLYLEARSTATDTDWIVKLCLVTAAGAVHDLTQGWLRASHRAVDNIRSKFYRPYHPHDHMDPLVPGKTTAFAIEILPIAQRFDPGSRLRLLLTSVDSDRFAMQALSHYPLGLPACNTVLSTSRLMVPLISGSLPGANDRP
jgi:predicted acyl esterase